MPRTATIQKRARKSKPKRPGNWNVVSIEGSPSASRVQVNQYTALTFSAVYRAVNILSGTIARFPKNVFREINEFERERLPSHPVQRLCKAPNQEQTAFQFWEYFVASLWLHGNAYAEIVRESGSGRPTALWSLDPTQVKLVRDSKTQLIFYEVTSEVGGTVRLPQSEVLHVPLLGDGLIGYSPISLARETIGEGISSQLTASSFYGNAMMIDGVLEHDEVLDDEAKAAIAKDLADRHSGPRKAHRLLLLEKGFTFKPMMMPMADAQFMESRPFTIKEIARWFGVPPHLLFDTTEYKYTSIEHLGIDFVTYGLMDCIVRIEQEIDRKLLGRSSSDEEVDDLFCKFNVNALLRGDLQARYAAYATARQWGWKSANDVLRTEDENLLPSDVGDIYLSPQNMIPAEFAGDVATALTTPRLAPTPQKPAQGESGRFNPQAFKPIVADAVRRLVLKELTIVRKSWSATKGADLAAHYDSYARHVRTAIRPIVSAIRGMGAPMQGIDSYVRSFVGRSLDMMKAALADRKFNADAPTEAWQQKRVDDLTAFLVTELDDGKA